MTDRLAKAPAPVAHRPGWLRRFIRTYLIERTLWRVPRTDKVLDLCCGHGFYFSINPHAHGVDGDPESLTVLRGRGHAVVQSDVLQGLPYRDGAFESVIAHDVLEHFTFDELTRLLTEVHRVLAPRGTFLVFVPNRKGYDFGVDIRVGHQLFVTQVEIRQLIAGKFALRRNYPEPLPRWIGQYFTHNKEVFELERL